MSNPFAAAIKSLQMDSIRIRAYAHSVNCTIESNARYKEEQLKQAREYQAAIRVLEAAGRVNKGAVLDWVDYSYEIPEGTPEDEDPRKLFDLINALPDKEDK